MHNKHKLINILIILSLLIALVGSTGSVAGAAQARAHPLLLQIAAQTPDKLVSVIVQKADQTQRAEALVEKLGGRVTKDLGIIHAFAAELSASAAQKLAAAPLVRWVSLDAVVEGSGDAAALLATVTTNTYLDTLGVPAVWNMGLTGASIGVALVDSGISPTKDVVVKQSVSFNKNASSVVDFYGHGTHLSGILAGNGSLSNGKFRGVAPGITLYNLKVSDDAGMAFESDVVAALQWVYNNKAAFNIRVVNISLNSTVEQSYHTSPLDAACEILWFNGVVVVVSSGNASSSINYANTPPANDPFVITVGAADEKITANPGDDAIASYTSWAVTTNGFLKPDIFAPGSNIISTLSPHSNWSTVAPARVVDSYYFRLSGTSMAAPMVSGAAALLLQDEPNLTPDQVKFRLLNATSRRLTYRVSNKLSYTWPYLDIYATVTGVTTASANTSRTASQLLWSGSEPVTWSSVAWNSVAWNSVAWNSVAWNSVAWNSVAWNSAYWGP